MYQQSARMMLASDSRHDRSKFTKPRRALVDSKLSPPPPPCYPYSVSSSNHLNFGSAILVGPFSLLNLASAVPKSSSVLVSADDDD